MSRLLQQIDYPTSYLILLRRSSLQISYISWRQVLISIQFYIDFCIIKTVDKI